MNFAIKDYKNELLPSLNFGIFLSLSLLWFQTFANSNLSCDQIFMPKSYPLMQDQILVPDIDVAYSLKNYEGRKNWSIFPELKDWQIELRSFFDSQPASLTETQMITLASYVAKISYTELVASKHNRSESSESEPLRFFGEFKGQILYSEILRFWQSRKLSHEGFSLGHWNIFEINRQVFKLNSLQDPQLLRFLMANSVEQFQSEQSLNVTNKISPQAFSATTTLTESDLRLRLTLLETVLKKPMKKPFLNFMELKLLTYLSNEIWALAPRMPDHEVALVLQQYIHFLAPLFQIRVHPFLDDPTLRVPRSMQDAQSAVKKLATLSEVYAPLLVDEFTTMTAKISSRYKAQNQARQQQSDVIFNDYLKDQVGTWNNQDHYFDTYSPFVLLNFLSKIPHRHEQKEWAAAFHEYIKDKEVFLTNKDLRDKVRFLMNAGE